MSIEELATFVEAALAGSMAGASRTLGVPTSTVSRRIHRLEDDLGAQLVESHARLFRLTETGQRLFERSASAVRDLREASHAIRDGSDTTRGQLRVSAPQDLGSAQVMADLFSAFRRAHPTIEVLFDLTDRQVDLLGDGIDFAFRAHSGEIHAHASVMARRLAPLDGGLFASPDYLDERGTPTSTEDLQSQGHALIRPEVGVPLAVYSGDARYALAALPSPVRSTSMSFMTPGAIAGLGIAPIPFLLAETAVSRGQLRRVLPDWHLSSASLSLLWPSSRIPSPRRRAFLDFTTTYTRGWSGGLGIP